MTKKVAPELRVPVETWAKWRPRDPSKVPFTGLYKAEMLRGRVKWPGLPFPGTALLYVFNKHPVASLSAVHPKHPLSQTERLFIFLLDVAVRFWLAMAFQIQAVELQRNEDPLVQATAMTPFQQSIFVAIITNVVISIMQFFATIDDRCCGSLRDEDSLMRRIGVLVSTWGVRGVLAINVVIDIAMAGAGFLLYGVNPVPYAITLFASAANSYTWTWALMHLLPFLYQYFSDSRRDAAMRRKGYRPNISYRQYNHWRTNDLDDPTEIAEGKAPCIYIPASVDPDSPEARDPLVWEHTLGLPEGAGAAAASDATPGPTPPETA